MKSIFFSSIICVPSGVGASMDLIESVIEEMALEVIFEMHK